MSRVSVDQYDSDSRLVNGFDYINQAWVQNGVYTGCNHSEELACRCWARLNAGKTAIVGSDARGHQVSKPVPVPVPQIPYSRY
jgi:hypothetical protein